MANDHRLDEEQQLGIIAAHKAKFASAEQVKAQLKASLLTPQNMVSSEIFMKNFLVNRKSMHSEVLEKIPLAFITQEMTCLHGALNFINNYSQNHK